MAERDVLLKLEQTYKELEYDPVRVGVRWNLISHKWLNEFRMACRHAVKGEDFLMPGPIDNSHLVDEKGELLPQLGEGSAFDLVSPQLWSTLEQHFTGGPAISRPVVAFSRDGVEHVVVEVYPVSLQLEYGKKRKLMIASKSEQTAKLMRRATAEFDLDMEDVVIHVTVDGQSPFVLEDDGEHVGHVILGESAVLTLVDRMQRQQSGGSMEEINLEEKGDGSDSDSSENSYDTPRGEAFMRIHGQGASGLRQRGVGSIGGGMSSQYESLNDNDDSDAKYSSDEDDAAGGGAAVSREVEMGPINRRSRTTTATTSTSSWATGGTSSRNNASAWDDDDDDYDSSYNRIGTWNDNRYGGIQQSRPVVPSGPIEIRPGGGLKGLQNLGNTCFMNSGLQCLSNTEPLLRYMLSNGYESDINRDNPLGMGGKLAVAFAHLMKTIWSTSSSSVNPSELKTLIGRFAFQFTGYSQHDSQELLAFLLDGIHEDLNRVLKKPPTEQVVGNGVDDETDAAESWYRHLLRNRSVIVDHFQGQYRSELHCPNCHEVSTNFDPYMYLTLQLPEDKTCYRQVTFVSSDPTKCPLQIGLTLPKGSTIGDAKVEIAKRVGVCVSHLAMADIWENRAYKWYSNKEKIESLSPSDNVHAFDAGVEITAENAPRFSHGSLSSRGFSSFSEETKHHIKVVLIRRQDIYATRWRCIAPPLLVAFPADETHTVAQLTRVLKPKSGDSEFEADTPFVIQSAADSAISAGYSLGEPDEAVDLFEVAAFYVDWSERGMATRCEVSELNKFDVDESVRGKKTGDAALGGVELSACLDAFVEPEELGPNDKWRCLKCKEEVQAQKQMSLWSCPEILVIHLKRFSADEFWREKLETLVNFPLEGLDMSRYLHRRGGPLLYDLYAVSNHFGSPAFGHYTAYAKPPMSEKWYDFNDSFVSETDPSSVVSSGAYLLFYKRRGAATPESTSAIRKPLPDGSSLPSTAAAVATLDTAATHSTRDKMQDDDDDDDASTVDENPLREPSQEWENVGKEEEEDMDCDKQIEGSPVPSLSSASDIVEAHPQEHFQEHLQSENAEAMED